MKLFIATAAAALISTAAVASEKSTKYYDLRLDTSKNAEVIYSDDVRPTDLDAAQRGADQDFSTANDEITPDVTFSTRSAIRSAGEGYVYGGFGPGNDSR
ncbi:hypothetical protein AB2B41_15310 [Marimonas sp. MJW-29]|uniref:Uncharacterized protein n=1 Tax=Sulfitobacter sediminis TaxID=3234186 RepID=A0ABV3RPS6_9RHOB